MIVYVNVPRIMCIDDKDKNQNEKTVALADTVFLCTVCRSLGYAARMATCLRSSYLPSKSAPKFDNTNTTAIMMVA